MVRAQYKQETLLYHLHLNLPSSISNPIGQRGWGACPAPLRPAVPFPLASFRCSIAAQLAHATVVPAILMLWKWNLGLLFPWMGCFCISLISVVLLDIFLECINYPSPEAETLSPIACYLMNGAFFILIGLVGLPTALFASISPSASQGRNQDPAHRFPWQAPTAEWHRDRSCDGHGVEHRVRPPLQRGGRGDARLGGLTKLPPTGKTAAAMNDPGQVRGCPGERSCTIGGMSLPRRARILLVEETTARWVRPGVEAGEMSVSRGCPVARGFLAGAPEVKGRGRNTLGTLAMPLCLHLLELPSMKEQSHVTHLTGQGRHVCPTCETSSQRNDFSMQLPPPSPWPPFLSLSPTTSFLPPLSFFLPLLLPSMDLPPFLPVPAADFAWGSQSLFRPQYIKLCCPGLPTHHTSGNGIGREWINQFFVQLLFLSSDAGKCHPPHRGNGIGEVNGSIVLFFNSMFSFSNWSFGLLRFAIVPQPPYGQELYRIDWRRKTVDFRKTSFGSPKTSI